LLFGHSFSPFPIIYPSGSAAIDISAGTKCRGVGKKSDYSFLDIFTDTFFLFLLAAKPGMTPGSTRIE